MNNTLSKIGIFVAGAAVGTAATWFLVKAKYEQIAQEDSASVREMYEKRLEELKNREPEPTEDSEDEAVEEETEESTDDEQMDMRAYATKLSKEGYTNYSNVEQQAEEKVKKGGSEMADKPYVIPPDDYDTLDDYEAESLTYYADGILTDYWGDPIDDVENLIGEDSLTHFGEYEEDSVFVRNERLKTDYEILLDVRNYKDVRKGSDEVPY